MLAHEVELNTEQPDLVESLDLRRQYPLSVRRCLKRCLRSIVIVVALAIALLVLENNSGDVFGENITAALDLVLHWALAASLLYVAGRFLYEYLSLKTDAYWVKTGNLVVRRGVIIRKLGSFPLSRITDIYLAEDLLDVIFFLRNLQISTPSIESGPFAQIDGLSPGTATALRRELQELARVNRIFESTKTMEKPKEVGDLGMRDA